MITLRKTFDCGKIDYYGRGRRINPVEVDIELSYTGEGKPRFSASAIVYNQTKTHALTAGQCLDDIAQKINDETFNLIYGLWKRNHLNDMHAGTEEQEEALKSCASHAYRDQCEYLKRVGLYEVVVDGKPYKYGQGWLYRAMSDNDMRQINELLS